METKIFQSKNGKPVVEVSFAEPGILLVKAMNNPGDEYFAAELSGYITHLFESEGLHSVLVDGTQGVGLSPEAIDLFAKSDMLTFVKKVAVYGITNSIFRLAMEAVIKASGRDNLRLFSTREEALAYLKEQPIDDHSSQTPTN